ncbi:FAD linked oxidase [Macrophomina phaseolina MS6]|uniref:FAD linked oxidase n=1 Tax=Macrophomina phaseolina (strain MS6) TaxID=1126212 RepID=K2S4E1_MACPH|nr:FAD linked oxidase [Macrophomina phaseolina MS6]
MRLAPPYAGPSFSAALTVLVLAGVPHAGSTATEADWHALNASLGNSLQRAQPLAAPCFSEVSGVAKAPDEAQCAFIQDNYLNATYRTSLYSGFIHPYNEGCASSTTDQCLLNPNAPATTPVEGNCTQGLVSERYIEVTGPESVQAALAFSLRTGTPLSIKASGHDYLARSSSKDSLALWTRNLKDMAYHPSFIPSGCGEQKPVQAITIGAGASLGEVYAFADAHNVTFVGGSSATVTAAGGFTLFGGHGVLSPLYGLSADRVLEFRIVTADGVLRTVNKRTHPRLFWALRGGGAGAFGVVLSATFKVEPSIPLVLAYMSFNTTASPAATTTSFLTLLAENAPRWADDGWGGPMGPSYIAMVNPRLPLAAAQRSMASVTAYVAARGGSVSFREFPSFYPFYQEFVAPASSTGLGQPLLATFRTVPRALHASPAGIANITATLQGLAAAGITPAIFQTTPVKYRSSEGGSNYNSSSAASSVHPGWRDSYWLVGGSTQWAWNATLEQRAGVAASLQRATADLAALAPDGGAYPNEADPWTPDWRAQFWGPHYAELLAIKREYDPYGLLRCWKCVGFEEEDVTAAGGDKCWNIFEQGAGQRV